MLRRKVQHACGVAWRARSSTDDAPLRQDDVKGWNLQVALRYADEAQRALRPKGAEIVLPGKVGRHGDENEVKERAALCNSSEFFVAINRDAPSCRASSSFEWCEDIALTSHPTLPRNC